MELLLDQEVDVIVRNEDNWTSLSLTARYRNKSLTHHLFLKSVKQNSMVKITIAEAIENALWQASESLLLAAKDLDQAKQDSI